MPVHVKPLLFSTQIHATFYKILCILMCDYFIPWQALHFHVILLHSSVHCELLCMIVNSTHPMHLSNG